MKLRDSGYTGRDRNKQLWLSSESIDCSCFLILIAAKPQQMLPSEVGLKLRFFEKWCQKLHRICQRNSSHQNIRTHIIFSTKCKHMLIFLIPLAYCLPIYKTTIKSCWLLINTFLSCPCMGLSSLYPTLPPAKLWKGWNRNSITYGS